LEKKCLQCCSKLIITKRWVAEIVKQRVPGRQADNRECPIAERAATMSWNDELVVADRAKMLVLAMSEVSVQQATRYKGNR